MTKRTSSTSERADTPERPSRKSLLVRLRAAHAREAELERRELAARERVRALDWQVTRAMRRMRRVRVEDAERQAHVAAGAALGLARQELLGLVARRRRLAALAVALTRRLVGRGGE